MQLIGESFISREGPVGGAYQTYTLGGSVSSDPGREANIL